MIEGFEDLRRVLKVVYGNASPPRPLHLVEAVAVVRNGGHSVQEAARQFGTTVKRLQEVVSAPSPLVSILGCEITQPSPRIEARVRSILGQLVIGNLAERVFENMYRTTVGTTDLELRDDRRARGDTDYLVFNGSERQVFRINIKFHGAVFRRARDLVGLDPEDCFALATYKIHGALQKQEAEHLPYIFVIVGVPGLTGTAVGERIPGDLMHLSVISYEAPRLKIGRAHV